MKSRFEVTRRLLIYWTLFIGIGAVTGYAAWVFQKPFINSGDVGLDG